MKKLANFIVDKRFVIFAIFAVLLIASIVLIFFVNINSDLLSYLPDGLPMTDGLSFLQENFGMQGDAMIGVSDITYDEMLQVVEKLKQFEGEDKNGNPLGIKKGGIIWIGVIDQMRDTTLPGIAQSIVGEVNFEEMSDTMLSSQELLKVFYPNPDENGVITFNKDIKAKYMFMIQMNIASSTNQAMNLLNEIDDILENYEHSIGGSTKIVKDIFDSTINEMYKYILVACLVMFIVLLLTTNTLIDPIIFILAIGVSIIINLGTNILFPDVSIVTFACSAVLQLGLSMDYAIFLMHAFAEEKKKCPLDEKLAMKRAIPKTFTTVTASALTTIGGFLALFVMRFEIGVDLGRVLAKGVLLSLITVIFLQPCLMLMMSKASAKTAHKIRLPKFKSVGKFSISKRYFIVILAIIILIPAAVLQQLESNNLTYIKFVDAPEYEEGSIHKDVERLSNSIIALVPVGKEKNEAVLEDLSKVDGVVAYMSAYSMIPEGEDYDRLKDMLSNKLAMQMAGSMKGMELMGGFVNNGYTLLEIMIDCDAESEEAERMLGEITAILDNNFGKNTEETRSYYITGMAQAVIDLKGITPTDFLLVTAISVLIILIILMISQKSIKLPIILVALIELGIFINLALCYIAKEEINFMCFIILSSIQLGSTVDYAILFTDKYQKNLEYMAANEAAYTALRDSATSILTSVAIMAGCCLSVTVVASNAIVRQITWLIARGSIISGILTIVVLPALLVVFTGNKKLKAHGKQQSRLLKTIDKQEKKDAKKSEAI